MSFLTLAAVPWDNHVSFSILDNDVYTFGKCRFIKPCHSKMKDITHGKRIGSIKTTIFALTNLIKNTKEHERDNRKDQRGYGRSSG